MKSLDYLKSISNPTKLRLISLLLNGELCVCELEEITLIKQVNISKNLISLKDSGIVEVRREKQRGFYSLTDNFKSNKNLMLHIIDLKNQEDILTKDYKEYLKHEEVKDDNVYVCHAYRNEAKI
jgi:ArsR family transcriptional regulator